jgi:hypothetical protein
MKKVCIMLIVYFSCLVAKNNIECISLGEVCTTGAALQAFDLRNAAYPFDWNISFYESLCAILENDFKDFLNPEYLIVREDNLGIINKYGLVFVHDFPTTHQTHDIETTDIVGQGAVDPCWLDFLPDIEKKYERRIERFRETCSSDKQVYFIRHFGIHSLEEARHLRDLITKKYPQLDFILVIIGNDPSFGISWEEPGIKNYFLDMKEVWNDVAEWKRIFLDLNLISSSDDTTDVKKHSYHNYYRQHHRPDTY